MRTLTFRNGDEMPALGLGTWKSAPGDVGGAVRAALEIGYRHIDCAAIYGNEKEVGEALAGAMRDGVVSRGDLWITSKLWCTHHREEDVRPAIEATLSDLGLDHLDLYLVHWPVALVKEPNSPLEPGDLVSLDEIPLRETWGGMEALVDAGLAKHIGVSNDSVPKLEMHLDARIVPEMDQVEMHPYLQQPDLVAFAKEHAIHVTAYSPLGSPDRPDVMRGDDDPVLLDDATIGAIAGDLGATPAQVLLAWGLQRGTSVIPKSTNPERLAQNFAAASLELPADAMSAIDALDRARRYCDGEFWCLEGSAYTVEELWDE